MSVSKMSLVTVVSLKLPSGDTVYLDACWSGVKNLHESARFLMDSGFTDDALALVVKYAGLSTIQAEDFISSDLIDC